MPDHNSPISPIDASKPSRIAAQEEVAKEAIIQEASEESFTAWGDEGAFSASMRLFRSLEEMKKQRPEKKEGEQKTSNDAKIQAIQRAERAAEELAKKNPEIQARSLMILKQRLSGEETAEEILQKVLASYPDVSLADEALDFLIATSSGAFQSRIRQAKDDLGARFGREIRAGKNIAKESREFSEKGLGTATALRELYAAITGNPREAATLFHDLSGKFHYDKLQIVIDFLLHSLGQDLKSKGPSIDKGELHRLMSEGRSMQAILGIFRFFRSRMKLIMESFERQGLQRPMRITFELLAKLFMTFLQERYPSGEKAQQMVTALGLNNSLEGQVIVFTQMRDGTRHIAPKLFRSEEHRQAILKAFIDVIELIDDQLEENEEDEE